jgi:hypothetical protein
MPKPAISFMVPPKLWNSFKAQTDSLFLSRAPFLNYMLKRELVHLREDLSGTTLTTRAKRYISGELKRQGPNTSVNIEVEPETADALRAAVAEHNLVRDAVMCRLIIFLRSTDALLKHLDIPRVANDRWLGSSLEEMPASPLAAMEAVRDDPLFYIRSYLRDRYQCGVYRVDLPVTWAACCLEDELVPGTRAYRKRQKESDAFTAALTDAPAARSRRAGGRK